MIIDDLIAYPIGTIRKCVIVVAHKYQYGDLRYRRFVYWELKTAYVKHPQLKQGSPSGLWTHKWHRVKVVMTEKGWCEIGPVIKPKD